MKIIKYELVEINVGLNDGRTQFPFLQQPTLASDDTNGDIGIRGIEIFTIDSVPLSFSGKPVSSFAQIQNAVLSLQLKKGNKGINKIPLIKLLHVTNAAAAYFAQSFTDEFDDLEIDWVNSYISIPAVFGAVAAFTYLFGFSYASYPKGSLEQNKTARSRTL